MMFPPLAHFDTIDADTANACLALWGHRMGPMKRPFETPVCHALYRHGEPVAVLMTAPLIGATAAGFDRTEAFELARLCAADPHMCRPALRLWREVALPELCRAKGWRWAISYQDEALHSGNTYRLDGWVDLEQSRSGTDQRSGRKGRSKRIWAWPRDAAIVHAERRNVAVAA